MKIVFHNLNLNETTTNGTKALLWLMAGYDVRTVCK